MARLCVWAKCRNKVSKVHNRRNQIYWYTGRWMNFMMESCRIIWAPTGSFIVRCETTLVKLAEELRKECDRGELVAIVMDLSKALDVIPSWRYWGTVSPMQISEIQGWGHLLQLGRKREALGISSRRGVSQDQCYLPFYQGSPSSSRWEDRDQAVIAYADSYQPFGKRP